MEQILPGVSIEVRPEGLIVPGQISIGTIGIVGTANRGPVNEPVLIGSMPAATRAFGRADAYVTANAGNELTLVRAMDLAYDNGARDVIAVRVANGATAAEFLVASASGDCCRLTASTPGSWANELEINISAATENAVVNGEVHTGPAPIQLAHTTILASVRNTVSVVPDGSTVPVLPTVVHDAAPAAGEAAIDTATGQLTFPAGEEPGLNDTVTVTYIVPAANSVKVTLRFDGEEESVTAASGAHLVSQLNADSDLATGANEANAAEVPTAFASTVDFRAFGSGTNASGTNGSVGADHAAGLDELLDQSAHIIVAAGQSHTDVGADLTAHVEQASSDTNKRERIGVVGSALDDSLNDTLEHTLNSDRMIFVAPGIVVRDAASGEQVTLSGGYAAAVVAGKIAGFSVHRSLTNKTIAVSDLETIYSPAELRQLVQGRVLALERRLGFRTVKGITTSTNTAWHQITTRRIVDKAKFGVRSAANPYIGLLNNERVRAALKSTINSFLAEMVLDEELVSYELDVSATRDDEIRGIARVTIVLRPTFSIDFIKVTMFLE